MFDCFDTQGEKIRRIGVASIKRVLRDLSSVTDISEPDLAFVSCPGVGVYIVRFENEYSICHIDSAGKSILDEEHSRDKCIQMFMQIREEEMKGTTEDE